MTLNQDSLIKDLSNGGLLLVTDQKATVSWPDGTLAEVNLLQRDWLNLKVTVPESRRGRLTGLLGKFDGNHQNDFKTRDGTLLSTPPTLNQMQLVFGESWRIRQDESLFDYAAGTDTETFSDRTFNSKYLSVAELDTATRQSAYQECVAAGIVSKSLLTKCTVDVAITGNKDWAYIAAGVDPNLKKVTLNPFKLSMTTGTTRTVGALLTGSGFNSRAVDWTTTGGTITVLSDNTISFTAPMSAGTFTLTARSREDNSVVGSADVQVLATTNTVSYPLDLTLHWSEEQHDLDALLWLPPSHPYIVNWQNLGNLTECPSAQLDWDHQGFSGHETITINQLMGTGKYQYWVHHPGEALEGARVQVKDAQGVRFEMTPPMEQAGGWWHVLNVDAQTGEVELVNTVGGLTAPYTTLDGGCGESSGRTLNFNKPLAH